MVSIEFNTQPPENELSYTLAAAIRSGTVLINGKEYEAEAEISTEVKSILRKLRSGH